MNLTGGIIHLIHLIHMYITYILYILYAHIYIYTYYPIKILLNIHQNPTRCCIPTSSRFCSFQRTSDHRATESDHGHASHWPGQLVWGKGCSTSWMVFLMEKKQKTNTKKKMDDK